MSNPPSLVIVRCQRCRKRLGSLDTMPDDWSGTLDIIRCPKCVIPSPGRLVRVLKQQNASGGFAVGATIPLAELRSEALKAQRQGRPVTVSIPPISAARY